MTDARKQKVLERAWEISAQQKSLDDLCAQIADVQDKPGAISSIRAHYENMNDVDARREIALRIAKLEALRNENKSK